MAHAVCTLQCYKDEIVKLHLLEIEKFSKQLTQKAPHHLK